MAVTSFVPFTSDGKVSFSNVVNNGFGTPGSGSGSGSGSGFVGSGSDTGGFGVGGVGVIGVFALLTTAGSVIRIYRINSMPMINKFLMLV
ncbi:hypothetical protein GCM10027442_41480 [Emticicia fontis]